MLVLVEKRETLPPSAPSMMILIHTLGISILLLSLSAFALAAFQRKAQSQILLMLAWAAAVLLLAAHWILAQAPPFGNMRHVLSFFPIVLIPLSFYLKRCSHHQLTGYFALATALSITGALCMPLQAGWRQMPALQSPWFIPHVTSYVIAYGLLTVSFFLTLVSFHPHKSQRLEAAHDVLVLAFPFLTFGLWSGALWADEAWGRYWAWDIKETWSLITWTLYLFYFHLRKHHALRSWQRPVLLLAYAAVLVTFFVVNLLPRITSIHSYAG